MGAYPDGISDAAVIAASAGDPHRFAVLFDRHAPAVHRYLSSRAGAAQADDLCSETFLAAFRSRGRYDGRYDDARPWLFGIATNLLRHHHRDRHRHVQRLRALGPPGLDERDPAERVAEGLDAATEWARVARALDQLDEPQREVIVLVAGPGLTYDEIARALDLPVGTVRSRLARGRRRLRELLELDGQYEGSHAVPVPPPTEREIP
jgi:RNA polymerase sigma-70 factor (ECF subfamily)